MGIFSCKRCYRNFWGESLLFKRSDCIKFSVITMSSFSRSGNRWKPCCLFPDDRGDQLLLVKRLFQEANFSSNQHRKDGAGHSDLVIVNFFLQMCGVFSEAKLSTIKSSGMWVREIQLLFNSSNDIRIGRAHFRQVRLNLAWTIRYLKAYYLGVSCLNLTSEAARLST